MGVGQLQQRANKLVSTLHIPVCLLSDFHPSDLLLSAAPVESHVGAVVVRRCPFLHLLLQRNWLTLYICKDSPNACVTLGLSVGIFDFVSLNFA